jgi:hypothetical protein
MTVKITRGELKRVVRSEARRLLENVPNEKILPFNGQYFRVLESIQDLARDMDVEPVDLCESLMDTLRETSRRSRARSRR